MKHLKKIMLLFLTLQLISVVLIAQEKEKPDNPDDRTKFEFDRSRDPATGNVPTERLIQAIQLKNSIIASRQSTSNKTNVVSWIERGANNCGGLTRAIMYDPTDPSHKRVFVGGAGGGIWRCDDINAYAPTWTKMNDQYDNLAITCFAYNPANTQEMYAGTGNGFLAVNSMRGLGIFRSTDGGNNWTLLPYTKNNPAFYYVTEIGIDGYGQIYASTNGGGIQKSRDAGDTWTKILGLGVNGGPNNDGADVEILPNGTIYATFGLRYSQASAWRSFDGGTSFTNITPSTLGNFTGRLEIESAPTNPNKIIIVGNDKVFKSSDGGSTWTDPGAPSDPGAWPNSQSWHNLLCEISPVDENTIFVGALNPYRSTDGGVTWTRLSVSDDYSINNSTNTAIHGDLHHIIFNPANPGSALWASDGGIFLCDNMNGTVSFRSKNRGLNVTQYYGTAINPAAGSNLFLSGTQDNGTHSFMSAGLNDAWDELPRTDGGFSHIDNETPQLEIASSIFHSYKYAPNGNGSFLDIQLPSSFGNSNFINPTAWDNINNTLYATDGGGYLRFIYNGNLNWTSTAVPVTMGNTEIPSAISVDPNINNQVWMANAQYIYKIANANTTPTVTTYNTNGSYTTGSKASCIDVEPGKSDHLLLTYSNFGTNNILESTNGGASWTVCDGNLPDMPVYWIKFNPFNPDQAAIATEVGVWETLNLNGAATQWVPVGNNFPNTKGYMLKLRMSDKTLVAASHGRGIWTTTWPVNTDCRTSVYVTSITGNGATLNWDATSGSSNYLVEYKINGASTWNSVTVPASPYTLTTLSANTLYDCRVTPNCSTGGIPALAQFTTATASCGVPSGLSASGTSLTWSTVGSALNYTLEYKLSTSIDWLSIPGTTTQAPPFPKAGLLLEANSTYDWRVRANCSNNTIGAFVSGPQFSTTVTTCNAPTGLNTTAITATSATIAWLGTPGFRIEYKLSTSYQWITLATNATALSYDITGLAPGSTYDWRIRKRCSPLFSPVAQSQFTTSLPTCAVPSNLGSSNILPRSVTVNWFPAAGSVYYQVEYKTNNCSAWSNVINVTGTVAVLPGLNPSSLYDWRVRTVCDGNASAYVSAQFTTATDTVVHIYGNVWHDGNGLLDNWVNRNPTPWPGLNTSLFVYLVNVDSNKVVQDAYIQQDGTYSFADTCVKLNRSYKLVLTSIGAGVGDPCPARVLLANWQYKGEYLGECPGPGSDGTPDGQIFINTTNKDIYNANFGVRAPGGPDISTGRSPYVIK